MRKIRDLLPTFDNPKIQIEKWMREDNMYQVLRSTEFIIGLMRKNEEEITNLFTDQIVTIGEIVLGISITLIPILIISLLIANKNTSRHLATDWTALKMYISILAGKCSDKTLTQLTTLKRNSKWLKHFDLKILSRLQKRQ